ncbi:9067_t:CDS:10, partial [Dentiscutata heterogama]
DLGISECQLNSENSDNNKVNEPVNESMSDIENVENERTSIINEPNIGSGVVPFVFVNDPIPEFFVDKIKEPRTSNYPASNDSILVEDNDLDEEIEEQENLVRKRKINRDYKASKKAKKKDINITTEHNNESSHGGEQNNDVEVMSDLSKITLENSQANNLIDETTIRVSSNSNDSEFSELDYDTNLNISRKKKKFDKKGKEQDTNYKNRTSAYVDELSNSEPVNDDTLVNNEDSVNVNSEQRIEQSTKSNYPESKLLEFVDLLKKTRREKGTSESFKSHDPSKIFEMFSQPINNYFNEEVFEGLMESEQLPKKMEDIQSCSKYLKIWDSHYNNCKRLIGIQDYKMLKLTYSLTKVFFNMLKICYQEQVKDTSLAKNSDH